MVLFADAKDWLHFWDISHVGVVYLLRIKFLHLLFRYKAALISESLFGQILPTVVENFLARASELLFLPVFANFE
jgi:hypothetical protein